MTTQQIIRLAIFALIFVVPVVIRIMKAAQEQAQKRRIEQIRQAQVQEAMRTGRSVEEVMAAQMGVSYPQGQPPAAPAPVMVPPPGVPRTTSPVPQYGQPSPVPTGQSPQDRLRELAARRQAQIEAMRRQRAQGGSSSTQAQQPRPYSPPRTQQRQPQRPTPYQAAQSRRPAPTPAPQARAAPSFEEEARRLAADSSGKPAAPIRVVEPPPVGGVGSTRSRGGVGRADLRRAVMLREILDKPIALRQPDPES